MVFLHSSLLTSTREWNQMTQICAKSLFNQSFCGTLLSNQLFTQLLVSEQAITATEYQHIRFKRFGY